MGVYSDNLEEIRNRMTLGMIDPCMIISSKMLRRKKIDTYYEKIDYCLKKERSEDEKLKNMDLELEKLKLSYLVAEKMILGIINFEKIESEIIKLKLDVYRELLHHSYIKITEIISDAKKIMTESHINEMEVPEDVEEKILKQFMDSVIYELNNVKFEDSSEFRKIVHDCAKIIRRLKKKELLQSDKKLMGKYIDENYRMIKTNVRCRNCGKTFIRKDFPFCLNCYERN